MGDALDYRAMRFFLEKTALSVGGVWQGAKNLAGTVQRQVSSGPAGKALLGAGGGAGAGVALGGGAGALYGGYSGYADARNQGADVGTSTLHGLGGAFSGASTGAAIGAAAGGVAGGVAGATRHGALQAMTKGPLGAPMRMGQRFAHSVTGAGAGMPGHLNDIHAFDSSRLYQQHVDVAKSHLDNIRAGKLQTGVLWNTPAAKQLSNAERGLSNSLKAQSAAQEIEHMGGTHIPGVLHAMATNPRKYFSNVAKQEWYSTPRSVSGYAMKALPVVGAASSLMPGPSAQDTKVDPTTGETVTRNPSMLRRGSRGAFSAISLAAPGLSNMANALVAAPALTHIGDAIPNVLGA